MEAPTRGHSPMEWVGLNYTGPDPDPAKSKYKILYNAS